MAAHSAFAGIEVIILRPCAQRSIRCLLPGSRLSGEEKRMKYLVAWGLGVPGVLVVIWFLMSHH